MKFGKEFERELVPEWRAKYLDYRQGKKKLKAVARALRNANRPSPFKSATPSIRGDSRRLVRSPLSQGGNSSNGRPDGPPSPEDSFRQRNLPRPQSSPALPIRRGGATESSPLARDTTPQTPGRLARYGSIIGSPPEDGSPLSRITSQAAPSLRLPGPAIEGQQSSNNSPVLTGEVRPSSGPRTVSFDPLPHGVSMVGPRQRNADQARNRRSKDQTLPRLDSSSNTMRSDRSKFIKSVMTFRPHRSVTSSSQDSVPLEAYKEIEARQDEFFSFLDSELEKIDGFYREKEEAATARLAVLREQLHIMRDRRAEEIARASHGVDDSQNNKQNDTNAKEQSTSNGHSKDHTWLGTFDKAVDKAKLGHVGKTFKAMKDLGTPSGPSAVDLYKDYTRKPFSHEVAYRTAKHKLKVALAEYYRGLELLKSYSLLNRTAFRKIVKKYDKTVQTQPTGRYMSERVNKAHFVNSEIIEGHIYAVEDLYSRYFERGNRKLAVGKLRAKIARAGEFSQASFINGLMLAAGLAFGIEGMVYGIEMLSSPDELKTLQTTYLLQLYGGFFLAILMGLFFCLACRVWHKSKVNYTFVFEFDTRRQILDWRQLSEIPCLLFFALGLTVWLNFRQFGGDSMFVWWPLVLAVTVLVIMLNPLPILYPKSRQWFAYSLWRLFFAGIYPVEFRDFFMGDLFCSETYVVGNIEMFFCTYAQNPLWSHPTSCSSLNSRLLGFFTTLPGIWRALQCVRRYRDTKNVFPHLVNGGKYCFTILFYMTLSLYRIDNGTATKAIFILVGTIHGLYTSVWDLAMDWSLLDPYAKNKLLRPTLAYKSPWVYYAAMVIDPIIRFNFIVYIFFAHNHKHAALVNFVVAFSEVCRRGIWMTIRVENEHCANVGRFRAYRDAPLPYEITVPTPPKSSTTDSQGGDAEIRDGQSGDVETGRRNDQAPSGPMDGREYRESANQSVRRRDGWSMESPVTRALARAGTLIRLAHTQDFERKRKPGEEGQDDHGSHHGQDESDDDQSDQDLEEAELARMRAMRTTTSGSSS